MAVSYLANQISSASGPGPSFDYVIPASHYHFAYTLPGLPENAAPSVAGAQLREAIELIKMHFGTDDSRARTLLKEAARRAAEV